LGGAPGCTVVLHRQQTFIRLVRDPSPLNFAEAYVEGAIDIEGDLFAAMRIANSIEDLRVSALDRWRLVVALVRGCRGWPRSHHRRRRTRREHRGVPARRGPPPAATRG